MEGIERLHLFKAQASRAVGANIWRMSHNPYSPPLYSVRQRPFLPLPCVPFTAFGG